MSLITIEESDWIVYEGQRAVITQKGLEYLAELNRREAEEKRKHRTCRLTRKGRKLLKQMDKRRAERHLQDCDLLDELDALQS